MILGKLVQRMAVTVWESSVAGVYSKDENVVWFCTEGRSVSMRPVGAGCSVKRQICFFSSVGYRVKVIVVTP